MIKLKKIIKKYNNNLILDIESFDFEKGKSYMIVGNNGSGKSTLIKCILGINKINSGDIVINTKNIGYVPERYYFPDFCSIEKFLSSILELYSEENKDNLINYYCNLFSINKRKKLSKLSKGMSQKVLIIQALIHNPDLLIFDEPLNGLDPDSQKNFLHIVDKLKEAGKTIIIMTHYPSFYQNDFDYIVKIYNKNLYYENYKVIS